MKENLDKIEEAIQDIRSGKMIIVVDDENRENEGDLIMAAEKVTPEAINFILKHSSGVICAPITEDRCKELDLPMMVEKNTCHYNTAFTVSVDLRAEGITTGISVSDRARTIKALADSNTKPENLDRPGHVFPLKAKNGGVIRRTGHTEAAIDFSRLAGLSPAGALCEIVNEDGSMSRLPELMKFSEKHNLKIVSIEDLVAYRLEHESSIEKITSKEIETKYGIFTAITYNQTSNKLDHLVFTKGEWNGNESVLVKIITLDPKEALFQTILSSPPYEETFKLINQKHQGIIIFLNKESKTPDDRDFGIGAQILKNLSISRIKLLSNNPNTTKVGLGGFDIEITEIIPM